MTRPTRAELPPERIAEIGRRCLPADQFPGPWRVLEDEDATASIMDADGRLVARTIHSSGPELPAFLAEARTALPELLTELDAHIRARHLFIELMPQPPAPGHVADPTGRPDPDPFDFDLEAAEERAYQRVRDHWNDPALEWALARLNEYLLLPDLCPGSAPTDWQATNARVADIRAAFTEMDHLTRALAEARDLARELLGAGTEIAEDLGYLGRFDPDLDYDLLPAWLTNQPGAPETWQTPYADAEAQREAGMDATYEHDPDYGKDLDYDDEPLAIDGDTYETEA